MGAAGVCPGCGRRRACVSLPVPNPLLLSSISYPSCWHHSCPVPLFAIPGKASCPHPWETHDPGSFFYTQIFQLFQICFIPSSFLHDSPIFCVKVNLDPGLLVILQDDESVCVTLRLYQALSLDVYIHGILLFFARLFKGHYRISSNLVAEFHGMLPV